MKVYISQSTNIYYNLALENWLFLEAMKYDKIIFLWKNDPAVVIGRAQNPWLECNLVAMKADNVNIVRRQSGGGTVYHDLGNLNYTIISPKKEHDIKANLELICDILKLDNIDAYPNCRNDIVVDHNGETYKISGSAFREKKDRAFHHGTLLLNANTKKLYDYLHQPIDMSLDTKGVKSHRSKVLNLTEINPEIDSNNFIKNTILHFKSTQLSFINEETPLENNELVYSEIDKLKDWDWTFGKTLPFFKEFKDSRISKIEVKGGYIEDIYLNDNSVVNIASKRIKFNESISVSEIAQYII